MRRSKPARGGASAQRYSATATAPKATTAQLLSQSAQHLPRKLVQQFADGPSFQRSIRNSARMVIAVAQYPRFPDRAVAWQRCREQVRQTPAAPEAVLIDRFEPQRIERLMMNTLASRRSVLVGTMLLLTHWQRTPTCLACR